MKDVSKTFQSASDVILAPVKLRSVMVYSNDTVVTLRSRCNKTSHVKQVVSFFQEGRLTLKLEKCNLFAATASYTAHAICFWRLEPSTHKTGAIKDRTHPTNIAELCSFLEQYSLFYRIMPYFAPIIALLNSKLEKDELERFGALPPMM